jgi:rubrerythrin
VEYLERFSLSLSSSSFCGGREALFQFTGGVSVILIRSHAEYVAGGSLVEMIKEDLVAERIAIDSYRELIGFLGELDSTRSHMLKEILAVEEQHADEQADFLKGLPAGS